jgi:hypothetical protein
MIRICKSLTLEIVPYSEGRRKLLLGFKISMPIKSKEEKITLFKILAN